MINTSENQVDAHLNTPDESQYDVNAALFMIGSLAFDPDNAFKDIGLLMEEYGHNISPEVRRQINLRLRQMVISIVETLSKEAHVHRYRDISRIQESLQEQRAKAEIYKRRIQLLAPSTQQEFEASLMWVAEKGKEEDLDLLHQVRKSPPYQADNISALFDLAEQKILVRLHDPQQEMQTAFGLTEAEVALCLLGVGREPVSYQAQQTAEMLKQIKQSWEEQFQPDALKEWFRKPVPLFGGKTPQEAVIEGRAEEVWHILIRLGEGIPY